MAESHICLQMLIKKISSHCIYLAGAWGVGEGGLFSLMPPVLLWWGAAAGFFRAPAAENPDLSNTLYFRLDYHSMNLSKTIFKAWKVRV